jgi:hypothetical protein
MIRPRLNRSWSYPKQAPVSIKERTMNFAAVINGDKKEMLFIAIKKTYKERRSSFENLNDQKAYVANALSTFL